MPPNGEKRPRWLMVCKCGATVKASASTAEFSGFGDRSPRAGLREADFSRIGCAWVGSGARNDRGGLVGRDHAVLEGVPVTLEQHPPLERAGAHDGKPGHDVFA